MNIFFDTLKGDVLINTLWLTSLLASGAGQDAQFTGILSVVGSPQGNLALLNVTAVASGTVYPNTKLVGAGVAAGTMILAQRSGIPGGVGSYLVNIGQNVSSESMASTALTDLVAGSLALSGAATIANTLTVAAGASVQSLQLDTGTKTANATAGAATLNKNSGVITSEALTTAAGGTYTLTISDSAVAAGDFAMASVSNNTNTTGLPTVGTVTCTAGQIVIVIRNAHASAAFNGTLNIAFALLKA